MYKYQLFTILTTSIIYLKIDSRKKEVKKILKFKHFLLVE